MKLKAILCFNIKSFPSPDVYIKPINLKVRDFCAQRKFSVILGGTSQLHWEDWPNLK